MANKIKFDLDFWKIIRLICWIGLIIFLWKLLSGCAMQSTKVDAPVALPEADYAHWINTPESIEGEVKILIMPHHLLVKSFMEKLYGEVAKKNSYDRIVIIAPNHFGYGFNFIQTTDIISTEEKTLTKSDIAMLKEAPELDKDWIGKLTAAKVATIEPNYFSREHGVYIEYPFIKKSWPKATVVPLIIKRDTPQEKLDDLVSELRKLNEKGGNTLFLFSLDFTHYTSEDFAVQNDLKMIKWLEQTGVNELSYQSAQEVGKSSDQSSEESVAIDSPESLYVLGKLANGSGLSWNFWARTSSASLIKGLSPAQNTSHIFGYWLSYTAESA